MVRRVARGLSLIFLATENTVGPADSMRWAHMMAGCASKRLGISLPPPKRLLCPGQSWLTARATWHGRMGSRDSGIFVWPCWWREWRAQRAPLHAVCVPWCRREQFLPTWVRARVRSEVSLVHESVTASRCTLLVTKMVTIYATHVY